MQPLRPLQRCACLECVIAVISRCCPATHVIDTAPHAQAVVHYWAPWCEPCTFMDEVFRELATSAPASTAFLRVRIARALLPPPRILAHVL